MNNALLVLPAAVLAFALVTPRAAAQVGPSYCFGIACPCGNDDPTAGCGNLGYDGVSTTGADLLARSGGASVLQDDLVLGVSGVQPGQFGVVFMGGSSIGVPFGDGYRCVGGGIYRFPVRQANAGGEIQESSLVATSRTFHPGGEIAAGSTWYFQGWYRDPGGPCANDFNLTNGLPVTWLPGGGSLAHSQLAGNPLAEYPWFEYVRAINEGAPIHLAFDPALRPELLGRIADVYIVQSKTAAEWSGDPILVDVRAAGASAISFDGNDVPSCTYLLDSGTIPGTAGTALGIGYDLVVDVDRDGVLDPGEPIDGLSDEAGFYVVRDVAAPGPYAVVETTYSGGYYLGQNTFYPANIGTLDQLPLIVVSHGNGHDYRWYDHLGFHLASHGYVVMSHQNNTGPGIEAASTTTLTNTDYLLANQATIAGGALNGHLDSSRIAFVGHSRGGEGVVRAYYRVLTGNYTPVHFGADDILLVSSIAPVTHLLPSESRPELVNYHLWVGSADADVLGFPGSWPFAIFERALGARSSITLQGAGHAAFHNGAGSLVASGPCLLTRAEVHQIMRGQLLPLVAHYLRHEVPAEDFLWRQWESFKPIGAPPESNSCVVVTLDYRDGPPTEAFVLDDFETEPSTATSSSGGAVSSTVTNLVEGNLADGDSTLTWSAADPMNGMTRARTGEAHHGVVFDWAYPGYHEIAVVPAARDFREFVHLSFRACQGARHPNTAAALEDLTFLVTLRDTAGSTSSISVSAGGGGTEEPYQRTGYGIGAGWANEFETVRLRLTDFLAEGSGLDLSSIEAVRFEFGAPGTSPIGRLGLDEILVAGD